RFLERDAVVGASPRPREAGAGGGHGLEAEPRQVARAPGVPWIGDHEAAGLVQSPKPLTPRVHVRVRRRSSRGRGVHGTTTNVPFIPCLECESTWQKNSYSPGCVGVNFTVFLPMNMPRLALTSMPASFSKQVRLCGTMNAPFLTVSSTSWPALSFTRLGSNQ